MSLSLRPPLWAWIAAPLACAATLALGVWQIQRGDAKAALQQQYLSADASAASAASALDARSVAAPGQVSKARARGQYIAGRQLLLDNQTHRQQPGFHVWTPLRLAGGGLVIVDRGWIAPGPTREQLPSIDAPAGEVEVEGLWRALPQPGMRSGGNCEGSAWPRIVQYPSAEDLACIYGEPLAGGLLLLDPLSPAGYVREWRVTPDMPPEKHYAYAAQWFAFCALILFLFVKLNLKKTP